MDLSDLMGKSQNNEAFSDEELVQMLSYSPDSPESYRIMAEGNRISKELTDNQGEIHGQFSLNLSPCSCNCRFCSFSLSNGIFTQKTEISVEQAVQKALVFEKEGVNAIFLMTTAQYPFEKFLEMSREIKRHLDPHTVIIANVGDRTLKQARQVKDAGFAGVYHALRLREGTDTGLDPEQRRMSMRHFQEAGLLIGTCVEPIGPEHTPGEIARMIQFTASLNPSYSGAARRITIPGSPLARFGMISELRMAQIVAVTRIAMPRSTLGNCTHEPCTLGAIAGANLFWAEVGANPRDITENTEEGRGGTVAHCRSIYQEAQWEVFDGSSRYYAAGI